MSTSLEEWKNWFNDHREAIFADFFQFLSFKSIATDPAFHKETKACADWLVNYLNEIGLNVQKWDTSGQPVIFGEHVSAGKDRPTLLIYNHYDVQPVDPLELWDSDPFEPKVRDNNVFARGAQDNKGQCFYTLIAIKALLDMSKTLNFNLKIFIEGEEETGSVGTYEIFKEKADMLKSDYLLVVDVGLPAPNVPAITLGARGIMTMELSLRAADADMHSGSFGGIAYNPIRALVHILDACWDDQGRVAVPGFYDDVKEFSKEEKKQFYLEIDEEVMKQEFGLRALCPDTGYTIGESVAIRPMLEINGISGGYVGDGFKTVLPAIAKAKFSCRLVPHQDPKKIFSEITSHLKTHTPKGLELDIHMEQGACAFQSRADSPIAKLCAKAYEEVLGAPCQKILTGGSIPIVVDLCNISGAETVLIGYGLDTDQVHAPNEHFGIERFLQGFLTMGRIFEGLNE